MVQLVQYLHLRLEDLLVLLVLEVLVVLVVQERQCHLLVQCRHYFQVVLLVLEVLEFQHQ